MSQPGLLYLYGWGGSGKSTLARLLDGHPELAVMPFHDTLINSYALPDRTEILADDRNESLFDIVSFRQEYLVNSKYYELQRIHEGVPSRQDPSAEDSTSFSLSGFDFYDFEREWIHRLNQGGDFSHERVLLTILQTLFESWEGYPYDPDRCEYFVGFGCIREYPMRFLLENFSESKIIFIRRDPRGIIATDGARDTSGRTVDELLQTGWIYRIESQYRYAKNLASEFPDRIHFITFEELVLNTAACIDRISQFLGIEPTGTLEVPTYGGREIETETGAGYIGQINDRWEDILTEKQQRIANLQMESADTSSIDPTTYAAYLRSLFRWKAKEGYENFRTYLR